MATLTPTTELEAVNIMLSTVGEAPVSTLEVSGLTDVAIAKQILTEVSRAVQTKGWHFNTEINYELSPNTDGFITPPLNTLRIDTTPEYRDIDVTHRGTRLYNKVDHTYVFTDPLKLELIVMLAFTDMPEAARYYITIRASRIFQKRVLGSDVMEAFTQDDELQSLVTLKEAEGDTGDANVFNGSYSVMSILER